MDHEMGESRAGTEGQGGGGFSTHACGFELGALSLHLAHAIGREIKPYVGRVAQLCSCLWADIKRLRLATGFDIAYATHAG